MTRQDWHTVYKFMYSRAQLAIADLSPRVRASLEAKIPELTAYFDARRIDPALPNRWREYPDRAKGATFRTALDPTTGEIALDAPRRARKPPPVPNGKPAGEALDTVEDQLRASLDIAASGRILRACAPAPTAPDA
jgi:hypothetical protein